MKHIALWLRRWLQESLTVYFLLAHALTWALVLAGVPVIELPAEVVRASFAAAKGTAIWLLWLATGLWLFIP